MLKTQQILITGLFVWGLLVTPVLAQIEFEEHVIHDDFGEATCIHAADMDNDGDIDVVGSAFDDDAIAWWENDGNCEFEFHLVANDFDGAYSVYVMDLNDDGNIDIIGAAINSNDVNWWENDGDGGFEEHSINGNFSRPRCVYAADVDGDGDNDVLGASYGGNQIAWFENDGEGNFRTNVIAGNFMRANSVYATDLDGDGDIDVIGGGGWGYEVLAWWENDGEDDPSFDEHILAHRNAASVVSAADVDGDGDMDILAGAQYSDSFTWWENDGEDDPDFEAHQISDDINDPVAIYAADLDVDGDMDLITSAWAGGDFEWWENDGEDDPGFEAHSLSDNRNGACSVYAMDLDRDQDIDIIGAARGNSDLVLWWENNLDPAQEDPPDNPDLISPAADSVLIELSVELLWTSIIDSNDIEEIIYQAQWSTTEEFEEYDFADTEDRISYILEDLEDDTEYWWRVLATDTSTDLTAMSNQTWRFFTAVPEPPDAFNLLEPVNNAQLSVEDSRNVSLVWEESIDPDPDDSVSYKVYLSIAVEGNPFELSYYNIADSQFTMNLIDTLGLEYWENNIIAEWWVEAVSDDDAVGCISSFVFSVDPNSDVNYDNYADAPADFSIVSTFPNPFNSRITIGYSIPEAGFVSLNIYNQSGRLVENVINYNVGASHHSIIWDAAGFPAGIYFVRLIDKSKEMQTAKILLIK
ncbi:MAG: VCBS repeat-containing protein [Calditrichaeota bacterium]|nr:VCBS repeat-containing protein [Calditrichota bacterium]